MCIRDSVDTTGRAFVQGFLEDGVSKMIQLCENSSARYVNMADDATNTFSAVNPGCIVQVAYYSSGYWSGLFQCQYSSATVVEIADANSKFAVSDTDGTFCVYKGTTDVLTVKNRTGGAVNVTVNIIEGQGL